MSDTQHTCVAIYRTHTQTDEALSRLQLAGFGLNHLSFAGRDTWANAMGSYSTGEHYKYCGPLGAFWVKLWSVLRGRGIFCSYENGPMLIAGPLVGVVVAAHQDGSVEHNGDGLEAGLASLGIPGESIIQYSKALMNDQILLFIFGALEEINRARDILNETKAINHTLHHGAGDHLSLTIDGGSPATSGG